MFLNLAAYRFVRLNALAERREELLAHALRLNVRGTVLLAPEGINMNICAEPVEAEHFARAVRESLPGSLLECKRSDSYDWTFDRIKIRIKREIITFGHADLDPGAERAPSVSPADLARWLDQGCDDTGRPLALVDTRNAFEVGYGTFDNAIDPGTRCFTELPERMNALRQTIGNRRVVAFCTGGIRCEKAVAWMNRNGFADAVQLEGGVLRYFEDVGERHWRGSLFVFDQRESISPNLSPVGRA